MSGGIEGETRHVFGPVPSRRLGLSLAVSPIPRKTCNYSCIYCQLGRTRGMARERGAYADPDAVIAQVAEALAGPGPSPDAITFAGEGEPTLSSDLGRMIDGVKSLTKIPVCVITNGSLMWRADVREELDRADVVMPSLDAGDPQTFARINRPHGSVPFDRMVEGLVTFGRDRTARLWLEVMLVAGVNDGDASLLAIRRLVERIGPDRVYVNSPVRPPAEGDVEEPAPARLEEARRLLGALEPEAAGLPVQAAEPRPRSPGELVDILRVHPMSVAACAKLAPEVWVEDLVATGRLRRTRAGGRDFLVAADGQSNPAGKDAFEGGPDSGSGIGSNEHEDAAWTTRPQSGAGGSSRPGCREDGGT